jgi:hypothetical protein
MTLVELSRHGNLCNSESVKVGLTRGGWADGTKEMACRAYALYARQFVCKVAKTLVEGGFDFVRDVDGMKLFKKRK